MRPQNFGGNIFLEDVSAENKIIPPKIVKIGAILAKSGAHGTDMIISRKYNIAWIHGIMVLKMSSSKS